VGTKSRCSHGSIQPSDTVQELHARFDGHTGAALVLSQSILLLVLPLGVQTAEGGEFERC
jgi:hypothetical protein